MAITALCNRWVRFLLRFDRKGRYRFAAMQGAQGSAMLRAHGLDPQDPMSFLLLDEQGALTEASRLAVSAALSPGSGVSSHTGATAIKGRPKRASSSRRKREVEASTSGVMAGVLDFFDTRRARIISCAVYV